MGITVENVKVKLDYGRRLDITIPVGISTSKRGQEALDDIQAQAQEFAEALQNEYQKDGVQEVTADVGGRTIFDIGRLFKVENPNANQEE
jgi:hypothetical protein